jgi:hypothetical protein
VRLVLLRIVSGVWEVGSYLHPIRGHSSLLMRLQQSDPLFNMEVDVMMPVLNSELVYGWVQNEGGDRG